jgi:hypothetical protein
MVMYLLVFTGIVGVTAAVLCLIGLSLAAGAGWFRHARRQSTPSHPPARQEASEGRRWFVRPRDEFATHRSTLTKARQRQLPW